MRARLLWLVPIGLAALAAWALWLRPGATPERPPEAAPAGIPRPAPPDPEPQPPPAAEPVAPPADPELPEALAPEAPPPEAADDHGEAAPEPRSDVAWYAESPMSRVAHRVVRGWGARPDAEARGVVGAFVVVDPDLPEAELERLLRDIGRYHHAVDTLSVRVYDSEEAATYDRHVDGGVFGEAHLVASLNRNTALGIEALRLRGRVLEP